MSSETLTPDQQAFLDNCQLDFSDRFTDADTEYRQIYDAELPPPPIMCPWYGRPKFTGRRQHGRGGHGSYRQFDRYDNRDNRYGNRDRDNRYENRDNRYDNRDNRYENRDNRYENRDNRNDYDDRR